MLKEIINIQKSLEIKIYSNESKPFLTFSGKWGDGKIEIMKGLSVELSGDGGTIQQMLVAINPEKKGLGVKKSNLLDPENNPLKASPKPTKPATKAQFKSFVKETKKVFKSAAHGTHYGLRIKGIGYRSAVRTAVEVPSVGFISLPVEKPGKPRIFPKIPLGHTLDETGRFVELKLGKSHYEHFKLPENWQVAIENSKSQSLILSGGPYPDKVGLFASQIRDKNRPEVYKGKGVRFIGQEVTLKEGKKKGQ